MKLPALDCNCKPNYILFQVQIISFLLHLITEYERHYLNGVFKHIKQSQLGQNQCIYSSHVFSLRFEKVTEFG